MNKESRLLPHEEAKREYVELFGVFVKSEYYQRLVTVLSLIIAIACIGFAWYASDKIQTRERIVSRDKFGLLIPLSDAEGSKIDKQVIAAHLGQYIEDIRTITSDNIANTKLYNRAKKLTDMVAWEKVKSGIIQHWTSVGDGNTTISTPINAEITSVIALSKNSWSIEWTEYMNGGSSPENTTYWKAVTEIQTFPPTDAETILNNPAGIIVKDLTITQVLDTYRSKP